MISCFSLVRSRLKFNHKFEGQIMLLLRLGWDRVFRWWDRVFRWWDRVWNLTENLNLQMFFAGEIASRFRSDRVLRWRDRVWNLTTSFQVRSCWGSGEIVFCTGEIAFDIWTKICRWDRVEVQVKSCFSLVRSRLKLNRKFAGEIVLRFRWDRVFH